MAKITQVSYGHAFANSSYRIDLPAGYAVGDKTLHVDGGSGGLAVGDILRVVGDDQIQVVTTGITGAEDDIVISPGLGAAVANNAHVQKLGLTAITDWLDDGFEPGSEEPQQITFGDSTDGQDGVKLSGTIYVIGTNVPAVANRTWIRYESGGHYIVIGGNRGCRISIGESGVRKLGEGPRYVVLMYSCAGDNKGDCILATG